MKGEADKLLVAIEEAKIRAMKNWEPPPSRVAMHWDAYMRVRCDCRPHLIATSAGWDIEFNGVKIEIDNSVDGYEFRP